MKIPFSEIFKTATLEFWTEEAKSDSGFFLWFAAQCRAESGFDPKAVSPAGARGLMQIMPLTWREIRLYLPNLGTDIHSPENSIRAGIWYARWCFNRFPMIPNFHDRLLTAFASYNCGPSRIKRLIEKNGVVVFDRLYPLIPYKETRDYVSRIVRFHEEYVSAKNDE
ncbi:MAG: lytic transglycosylase domain-containing protein [bacterium]